jgi:GTP-binding protein Era
MARMAFKSGTVAIVGRPNAGKSTLVNGLTGHKVAIVSRLPQTTRNRIQGIVHCDNAELVLVDTPGIIRRDSALTRQMMDEVERSLEAIDILVLVVDATKKFGEGDRHALDLVSQFRGTRILLLNKIDIIAKPSLLPLMDTYGKALEFAEIIPISAKTGDGYAMLLEKLIKYLPEGEPHFPVDEYTDQPERFLAAEIVREKVLHRTREEVPHAVAVLLDHWQETESLVRIRATIYVEREGQKGIIIGKGGATLKVIGTGARQELESIFGIKIFLELYVKVQRDWRDTPALVRQLDWRRQLEQLSKE